jgi:hypothetical protein
MLSDIDICNIYKILKDMPSPFSTAFVAFPVTDYDEFFEFTLGIGESRLIKPIVIKNLRDQVMLEMSIRWMEAVETKRERKVS